MKLKIILSLAIKIKTEILEETSILSILMTMIVISTVENTKIM